MFTSGKVRCSSSSPCSLERTHPWRVHLAMRAQHAMDAGFAGDVDALIDQHRDDPRRWGVGEARFVGHGNDPRSFRLAQRVRWRGADGIGPVVVMHLAVARPPTLQGADSDARQRAGRW